LENGPQLADCSGGAGRAGPLVLPGKYTVLVAPGGGATLTAGMTVLPDPHFPLSDADRGRRDTALMSAWWLQQQLVAARDTVQILFGQMTAMRAGGSAAGDPERSTLDQVAAQAAQLQGQILRPLTNAYNLEAAMDGYAGVPTAAQLRELDEAWDDAIAGVAALNGLIQRDLPPLYNALGGSAKWSEIHPVPAPARR
jgi:hypothetical protein